LIQKYSPPDSIIAHFANQATTVPTFATISTQSRHYGLGQLGFGCSPRSDQFQQLGDIAGDASPGIGMI
jgi:hypothetical protein